MASEKSWYNDCGAEIPIYQLCGKEGETNMTIQKTSSPEAQGIPSGAVIRLVNKLKEQEIPMHSLLIARHGYLTAELYWRPYGRDVLHRMFSQTKSFTSLAIGLLEAEGTITLQDKICSYFPEFLPGNPDPWLQEMTIENLLMMETCHDKTTYKKTSTTENWVRSFFQTQPTHRPGTVFQYDTSASHTLCALVEKLTGQKMLDFLKDKVLRQIGFSEESYVLPDPFGVSMGGTGLMAKPVDMLRVGLMLLNEGKHPDDYGKKEGRQVYPGDYLKKALSFRTPAAAGLDTAQGYGYQFWMLPFQGFAMLGMGSQNLLCFPQQDMVIAFNADTQGIPNGSDIILNNIITELFEKLSDQPLPEDKESQEVLERLAEELTLPCLAKTIETPVQEIVNGKDFFLRRNSAGFKRIKVVFSTSEEGYLEYENERGSHQIPFGMGRLKECVFPEYGQRCVTSVAWLSEDTLYIRTWLTDESVASVHWKMFFGKDGSLTVRMHKTEETKFNEFQGLLNS